MNLSELIKTDFSMKDLKSAIKKASRAELLDALEVAPDPLVEKMIREELALGEE